MRDKNKRAAEPEIKEPVQDAAAGQTAEGVHTVTDEQMQQWAAQVEQLVKERDDYLNLAKRAQADLENYRRRNATLRIDALAEGKEEVAGAMLPVIDNLERALEAAENGPLKEGVQMTLRQMLEALSKLGMREIEAEKAMFDPALHHAVLKTPKSDEAEAGCVTKVLQKGYLFGEKVIRYAMVAVCEE